MTRAIVNIFPHGVPESQHRLTKRNHARYAQKCGAEYVVLQSEQPDSGTFCHRYLANFVAERFDQTLYLDIGCVVTADCPDIFSEVPVGFWGVIDQCGLSRFHENESESTQRQANALCDNANWPYVYLSRHINSQVMVMPRDSKDFYFPSSGDIVDCVAIDQLWLSVNLQLHDAQLRELDRRFNWSWSHRRFYEDMHQAFIVNLSDMPDRTELLQRLVRQNDDD